MVVVYKLKILSAAGKAVHLTSLGKVYDADYRKIPKYSDTQEIAVISLKFEQHGSTIK